MSLNKTWINFVRIKSASIPTQDIHSCSVYDTSSVILIVIVYSQKDYAYSVGESSGKQTQEMGIIVL